MPNPSTASRPIDHSKSSTSSSYSIVLQEGSASEGHQIVDNLGSVREGAPGNQLMPLSSQGRGNKNSDAQLRREDSDSSDVSVFTIQMIRYDGNLQQMRSDGLTAEGQISQHHTKNRKGEGGEDLLFVWILSTAPQPKVLPAVGGLHIDVTDLV